MRFYVSHNRPAATNAATGVCQRPDPTTHPHGHAEQNLPAILAAGTAPCPYHVALRLLRPYAGFGHLRLASVAKFLRRLVLVLSFPLEIDSERPELSGGPGEELDHGRAAPPAQEQLCDPGWRVRRAVWPGTGSQPSCLGGGRTPCLAS